MIIHYDKCPICLKYEPIEIHHISGNRKNNRNSNLIWIGHSCHKIVHKNLLGKPFGRITNKRKVELLYNTTRLNPLILDLRIKFLAKKYKIKVNLKKLTKGWL